jgi:hypothetical protein
MWQRRGREAIEAAGEGGAIDEREQPYADLAAELDRLGAMVRETVRSYVMEHARHDGRAAVEAMKWLESQSQRGADLSLTRAKARVERQRAAGELVERQRVEGVGVRVYLPEES